ncbi:uncharacterized protein [Ptychodera flava]|uniref:uncharacterized protein n=1 Tax=Ptychodera flava TaxID=63121 RepID=UPI003969F1C9
MLKRARVFLESKRKKIKDVICLSTAGAALTILVIIYYHNDYIVGYIPLRVCICLYLLLVVYIALQLLIPASNESNLTECLCILMLTVTMSVFDMSSMLFDSSVMSRKEPKVHRWLRCLQEGLFFSSLNAAVPFSSNLNFWAFYLVTLITLHSLLSSNEEEGLSYFYDEDHSSQQNTGRSGVKYPLAAVVALINFYILSDSTMLCSLNSLLLATIYFVLSEGLFERYLAWILMALQSPFVYGCEETISKLIHASVGVLLNFVLAAYLIYFNEKLFCVALLFFFNIYKPVKLIHESLIAQIRQHIRRMNNFRSASAEELKRFDDVCAICLTSMKSAVVTECSHTFHRHCLQRCLLVNNWCPLCKQTIIFQR